jgi:hypothetical protein
MEKVDTVVATLKALIRETCLELEGGSQGQIESEVKTAKLFKPLLPSSPYHDSHSTASERLSDIN